MEKEEAKKLSIKLLVIAEAAYLTTVDQEGYPHIRAVCNFRNGKHYPQFTQLFNKHQDDFLLYFITSTSSEKMAHIRANPSVSAYYCNPKEFHGLMLAGQIEIVTDLEIKKTLWHEGCEMHYPAGIEDPEYTILRLCPTFAKDWYQYGPFEFTLKEKR